MSDRAPVLIAYDGSDNADHAIAVAAELLGGGPAQLIHAWEPLGSAAARSAVYAIAYDDSGDLLAREQELADEVARRGSQLASQAGFQVTGAAVSASGPVWATIVEHANAIRPRVIVMGTRGLTGIKEALVGSVSHHVASHAHVPVLTVPLPRER